MTAASECSHLEQVKDVTPNAEGCASCLQVGDTWVNLRLCLSCGNVGCCDDSKNKHATGHFHETSHPIIRSFEPGEDWIAFSISSVCSTILGLMIIVRGTRAWFGYRGFSGAISITMIWLQFPRSRPSRSRGPKSTHNP